MRKSKFKDTVIRQDNVNDGENEYTYQLIMREGAKLASYRIPLYSVKVVMTNNDGDSTSASVKDVFADAGKAICFYGSKSRCCAFLMQIYDVEKRSDRIGRLWRKNRSRFHQGAASGNQSDFASRYYCEGGCDP